MWIAKSTILVLREIPARPGEIREGGEMRAEVLLILSCGDGRLVDAEAEPTS
jgi:hypothetical protein